MMRLLAFALFSLLCASALSAGVVIKQAYYRDTNSSLHLFVENKGAEPVTLQPPVVDGFDTASLKRDGSTAGPVLWYRSRPNPIPPGGTADVTITLAEPATKPIAVEVGAAGQSVKRMVQCIPEKLRFQAIRFSRDLRSIDIYTRWTDATALDSLKSIRMDGRNLAKNASPWPPKSFHGLAYVRIALDKPLVKGSFHTFEAASAAGLSTAYQIRAIPAEFLVGLYGSPGPESIIDWAAHGVNHYLSFRSLTPDVIDLLRASGLSCGAKYIPEPLVDRDTARVVQCDESAAARTLEEYAGKQGLLYHELVDEPDVADYYAGRRLGASGMELIGRADLCAANDPERYTFIQMDNTFRIRNFRVYGEAADVLATHRYSLGNSIRSEAGASTSTQLAFLDDLLETLGRFRAATEPSPFFMVPQFFDLGAGRQGRPPTIEEMRLQCFTMVAEGARGLIHYIHSGSGGGHEGGRRPELWDAMTAMHKELRLVGEFIQSGTPAPASWVTTGSPNIYARAVLGGDAITVILINRAHRSALDRFTCRPAYGVKVSVRIPPWIKASRLRVVPADRPGEILSTVSGSDLSFTLDELRDARCFILYPRD